MPAPLSRTLAEFASSLRYDQLPDRAVEAVRIGMTDTVGVMLSGIDMPVSRHALASIGTRGLSDEARLQLGRERASVADATLVNAATTSSVVFDDVAFAGCHTSTVLMPALLAEGEHIGASGRAVIAAYAAGYEAWARLSERDPDSYSGKGWHATACFGALAVALALANLRGFDSETTLRALGIAASMSGGITASFDTDVGPFQIGRAAAGGVLAARLAEAGMSAPADALERPGRGMMAALSPKGAVDLDTPLDDLGTAWRLETVGINVKQYPFGNMAQRAIDGVLDLVEEHDLRPAAVERVELLISDAQYAVISKSPSVINFVPSHSVPLAVAAAIVERGVTFAALREPFYSRPDVQALMRRVETVADSEVAADTQPNLGFSGGVRIHLAGGRVVEAPSVDYARGHWTRPMSEAELWRKFLSCAQAGRRDEASARVLFESLIRLDAVDTVAGLGA
jgi:2-methylcitrate dehydratase PrpD